LKNVKRVKIYLKKNLSEEQPDASSMPSGV